MYEIALIMLFGDRAKYLMLISAIAFATVLTTQQCSIFFGLMRWTVSTLDNTRVPVWVADPAVTQVNEFKALRDTDLNRVRSVEGVAWAQPYYFSLQQARLPNGEFKVVRMVGVDSTTLIGIPTPMLAGKLQDLRQANGVIIDQIGLRKINDEKGVHLKIGDTFEVNDHQLKIIGINNDVPSFFGYPVIYTTSDRLLQTIPEVRQNLSFILVQPKKGVTSEQVVKNIESKTHLKAFTEDQFFWATLLWFFKNTSIPITFGTTVLLGFIVGIAVSGQTFYTFILENLGSLGALKAMGATNALLCRMLLLQAFTAGLIGYGIGIGITSIFGMIASQAIQFPFYFYYKIPIFVLFLILCICSFSAFVGIRKISKLEASEVFRA